VTDDPYFQYPHLYETADLLAERVLYTEGSEDHIDLA